MLEFDTEKRLMTELRLSIHLIEDLLENLILLGATPENMKEQERVREVLARKKKKLEDIRKDRRRKASLKYAIHNREKMNSRAKLWYANKKNMG
jgi:hypothetical protein